MWNKQVLFKIITIQVDVCLLCISCDKKSNRQPLEETEYLEHFIDGKTIKLHYLDWGGSGEPLILIHGLGDSPYIFTDMAGSLKKKIIF